MNIVLASQSPRRKELLAQAGYQFTTLAADIDESVLHDESPKDYVLRLAIEKAKSIATCYQEHSNSVVLGSDTAVIYQQHILGKPESYEHFYQMMTMLSGKAHQVLTSVAVVKGSKVYTDVITTDVYFKTLSEQEICNYWHTNEPQDKAGGYGIQGIGGQLITHIKGSYSAVVGLPLCQTVELLRQAGVQSPLSINVKES